MGLLQTQFKQANFFNLALFFALISFSTNIVNAESNKSATQKILVWGDSLSAAYGIPVNKGWVNLMRKELDDDIEIVNGSVSGETTQGGLTRLPAALKKHQPDLVLLELGANDGLRGLPPKVTRNNLKRMIDKITASKAKVILFGMKIPPNYGLVYSQKFENIFTDLSDQYEIPFIPFFLEKIIVDLKLLQEDELHPTAAAQPILLNVVLPLIKQQL